jgi:hypothetical protein
MTGVKSSRQATGLRKPEVKAERGGYMGWIRKQEQVYVNLHEMETERRTPDVVWKQTRFT